MPMPTRPLPTQPTIAPPRGILHARSAEYAERFTHERSAPPDDLAPFIAHFWSVTWDLRGAPPFVVATLPHPCVHITVEKSRARVGGVATERFTRTLYGQASVFGIKFRPGMFEPWLKMPVKMSIARLANRIVTLRSLFGVTRFEPSLDGAIGFLRDHLPTHVSPHAIRARDLVERMEHDRDLIAVEDVAAFARCDRRALERLFAKYVGATPKWVAQRYRLHEAAELLRSDGDLATIAQSLGYFDQAHFARDFKEVIGLSPGAYQKSHRK